MALKISTNYLLDNWHSLRHTLEIYLINKQNVRVAARYNRLKTKAVILVTALEKLKYKHHPAQCIEVRHYSVMSQTQTSS